MTAGVAGLDAVEPEVVCAPVGEVDVAVLAAWLAGSTYAVAVIVPVNWPLDFSVPEDAATGVNWTP